MASAQLPHEPSDDASDDADDATDAADAAAAPSERRVRDDAALRAQEWRYLRLIVGVTAVVLTAAACGELRRAQGGAV